MADSDVVLADARDLDPAERDALTASQVRRVPADPATIAAALGRLGRMPVYLHVDVDIIALRTHRDRAMVDAMLLGGLRRCEVQGLRVEDLSAGERRLFVAEGKGGRQRVVPVSARFFAAVGAYLE